jgi:hypothetical protein
MDTLLALERATGSKGNRRQKKIAVDDAPAADAT